MTRLLPVAFALLCSAAYAATPASGELTDTSGPLTFTGGPFVLPNPTPFAHSNGTPLLCEPSLPNCDEFVINVKVPEKFRKEEKNKREVVQISVEWAAPADPLTAVTDYDIYLFDPAGNEIAAQASDAGIFETISLPLSAMPDGAYTLQVITFLPLGSSYTGEARLGRGDKSADFVEGRSGDGLLLGALPALGLLPLLSFVLLRRKSRS